MDALTTEPLDPGTPRYVQALDVFLRTWNRDRRSTDRFFRQVAGWPHFVGLVAVIRDEVVGMGFGSRSEPGQWWHDRVAEQLGADHPALQDAWVLTELAVDPHQRHRGIGTYLHDALLAAQPYPRALLSTQHDNAVARDMYERRGWRIIHPGFRFQALSEPYIVMALELGPGRTW